MSLTRSTQSFECRSHFWHCGQARRSFDDAMATNAQNLTSKADITDNITSLGAVIVSKEWLLLWRMLTRAPMHLSRQKNRPQ
jgi:hypothetical protein